MSGERQRCYIENSNVSDASSYFPTFPGFPAFPFGLVVFALAAAELASVDDDVDLSDVAANARARSSERVCAFSFCLALCSASSSAVLSNSACIHGLNNTRPHITRHLAANFIATWKRHKEIAAVKHKECAVHKGESSTKYSKTRKSCAGRSPVQSIGHARSCRRRIAAYWKEQTWRSQNCKYLPLL